MSLHQRPQPTFQKEYVVIVEYQREGYVLAVAKSYDTAVQLGAEILGENGFRVFNEMIALGQFIESYTIEGNWKSKPAFPKGFHNGNLGIKIKELNEEFSLPLYMSERQHASKVIDTTEMSEGIKNLNTLFGDWDWNYFAN